MFVLCATVCVNRCYVKFISKNNLYEFTLNGKTYCLCKSWTTLKKFHDPLLQFPWRQSLHFIMLQ